VTDPSPDVRNDRPPGSALVTASWAGTALYAVAALVSTIWLDAVIVVVIVSLVLFAIGTVAFLAAYVQAIGRSRYEAIGMGGLFFLAGGAAPASVQRQLVASLAIEVVVALVTASVRIYTPVAFGLLVPMYGLGLMGLWGARYGTFQPRSESS
jgi:hypothetical protein